MTDPARLDFPALPASLASPALGEVLSRAPWLRRTDPFPHVVAEDVFQPAFYQALVDQFRALLTEGYLPDPIDGHVEPERFHRSVRGYDAMTLRFLPGIRGPMAFFFTPAFHDLVARVAGIVPTGDINAGLHHHEPGSRTGWVHNDLNPGWFVDSPGRGAVNLGDARRCDYLYGRSFGGAGPPRRTVRAAAVLFYLNNPPWSPGDGGETGLYRSGDSPSDRPAATVPPRNNSLLIFRCTPHSYHAFQGNPKSPRSTVIFWLHARPEDIAAEWGDRAVVPWPGS